MAKKEEYKVIKEETIDLNFYAVRSKDGKWLRSRGYGGSGESWVEDFTKAKIWSSARGAKGQITWWAKNYPKFGVPDLVMITIGKCVYLDQADRVKESIDKSTREELVRKSTQLRRDIEYYTNRYQQDQKVALEKSEELKKTLEMVMSQLNGETKTCSRKGVMRAGESCRFNNNCTYPNCLH
jgi:hypothetical protein